MEKETDKANVKIPRTLIAYVHETSDSAVRVAFSRGIPASKKYAETEREIKDAVESIKANRALEADREVETVNVEQLAHITK